MTRDLNAHIHTNKFSSYLSEDTLLHHQNLFFALFAFFFLNIIRMHEREMRNRETFIDYY